MAKRKRRGQPPQHDARRFNIAPAQETPGQLSLSLRHLQPGFGVTELTEHQRSEFLVKWAKRSAFTWQQLQQQSKHGLGYELIPRRQIKPNPPEHLEEEKYMVFRHEGNLPFAGIKVRDTFHVLWIEKRFGQLYDHGR